MASLVFVVLLVTRPVTGRFACLVNDRSRFQELNASIDTIGDLVRKYASLLKAAALVDLVPILQDDWKAPFRPW
jgi:hypothetical protein